jgi:hypothetical protein
LIIDTMMNRISIFLIVTGLCLESCCNADFILPDYDFQAFAIDVSARIDVSCVPDAAYTTAGATADGNGYACVENPLHNRWFKFQATNSYIYVSVFVGGSEGTQRKTSVTLWEADGSTPITCVEYELDDDDIFLYNGSVTQGEWYYFSVDVDDSQSTGTFSVCLWTD